MTAGTPLASRPMRKLIGIMAVVLLAACATEEEIEAKQEEREAAIEDDVTLAECKTDAAGYMVAAVTITNNSADPSTYTVEVVFESPDGATQLGDGMAFANELGNGQSTTVEANSLTVAAGEFECRVADVTRFAS